MHKKQIISSKDYFVNIRKRYDFVNLNSKEFSIFLKKFCGILISKGRKSYSIKVFNFLLLNLKKRFNNDPMNLLYIIANKLMPIFIVGKKRYTTNVVDVPVLAYSNKKIFYILTWLIRQLRNKSNVIGIKKQDILNILINCAKPRSKNIAIDFKKRHDELLQNVKHNLRRFSYNRKILKAWEKKKLLLWRAKKWGI